MKYNELHMRVPILHIQSKIALLLCGNVSVCNRIDVQFLLMLVQFGACCCCVCI